LHKFFLRGDKLDKLLELLFAPVINDSAAWLGKMFSSLAEITLHIENTLVIVMDNDTAATANQTLNTIQKSTNVLATALVNIQKICLGMAVALITLKFLKKGFETYVLWTEGDADADPILLTTSFFKALAVAMSFPVLYGYLSDITASFTESVRVACGVSSKYMLLNPASLINAGLFNTLGILVAIIMLIILFLQFVKKGVEMFVLRLAFPLGCVGLLDSDRAMFKAMSQKLFQCCATVVVQVALSQLALSVVIAGHPIIGIAVIAAAMGTPKFLQEFMVPSTGGVNSATVYQVSRLVQMSKAVLRR
jgi:hypothetical protein